MTWVRRSFLRDGLAMGSIGLAGCAMSPFPEPDESVDAHPPGDPPLDPNGEWPSYRYDVGNTGANLEGEGLRDVETYWRLDADIGVSTVSNSWLANLQVSESGSTALTVRDPRTASVKTETNIQRGSGRGPPAFGSGLIVTATYGTLIAVDPATGGVRWRQNDLEAIIGPPSVYDERIVVTTLPTENSLGGLHAFEGDGSQLWHYENLDETWSTPAIADETVFIVGTEGLHAIDLNTGERVFRVPNVSNERWTPVVRDGIVYVVVEPTDESAQLVAVSTTDGNIRWRTKVRPGSEGEPPVVADDTIYARGREGLIAIDPTDGRKIRYTQPRTRPLGLVGDVLYTAADGVVYAYDTTESLRELWSYPTKDVRIQDTDGRAISGITPVNGAIYVAARDAFHGIGPTR